MIRRTLAALGLGAVAALAFTIAAAARAPDESAPSISPSPSPPASDPGPRRAAAERPSTAPPPASGSSSAGAAAWTTEASLMAELRSAAAVDPERAIVLAREGNRLFPDSPDAPERTSSLIHALARVGRASEARGAAEEMVNRYPDSWWVREIEAFTGAHRHRNVRLAADGRLEYY